jgi:acyl-CoA thioesterase FadM
MKGFILTMSGIVPTEWIDKNGHMNVASYMALFDHGTDVLLQESGLVVSGADSDITVVAGRIFIEHRKELLECESWELWSGFSTVQPSFMTVTHRLRSGSSLRAVCDIRGAVFSKSTRTAVILDRERLCNARTLIVPGLADRFWQKNGVAT